MSGCVDLNPEDFYSRLYSCVLAGILKVADVLSLLVEITKAGALYDLSYQTHAVFAMGRFAA